jgi:soluble lytic murein transglycosylase
MTVLRTGRRGAATGSRRPSSRPTTRIVRRRRTGAMVVAALVGLAVGLLIASGKVERTIEAVTLPLQHEDIIRQQAARRNLDPALIASVIYAESRFHDQTSHAGARGLMQITPETAKLIEKLSGGTTFTTNDLADPDINIRYGAYFLRYLLERYNGNEIAALAAYNAGETNVDAWGGADLTVDGIKFRETRGYVDQVLSKRHDYATNYKHELGLD